MKFVNKPLRGQNAILLNREVVLPADGWSMLACKGEHPIVAVSAGGEQNVFLQIVDDDACLAMVNRFNQDKESGEQLELLVDYDHFSDDLNQPSEAAGWIQELQNREDGLYGRIRWSRSGKAAVEGLEYRFISPVWLPTDCEELDNRRLRPLRLDKAAVTNEPNIKGMKPLANRDNNVPEGGGKESIMDFKALLLALLGLAPEATDEEISTGVDGIKGKLTNAEAVEGELEEKKTELEKLQNSELEGQVEDDMEEFKDVIKEDNKEEVKDQLMKNRAATRAVLASIVKPAASPQKILNRKDGKKPAAASQAEAEKSEKRQRFVDELKLKNRCNNSQAWAQAASLKPELFV